MAQHRLLLVEDDEAVRFPLTRFFAANGLDVDVAASAADAEERFAAGRPDVVLLDYSLPDRNGLELLRRLRTADPAVPVVFLTAHGSIDLAVRAVKEGAEQFFTKPPDFAALLLVIQRLVEHARNRQAKLAGRTQEARQRVDPFVGESDAVKRLADVAQRVAAAGNPVLVLGETGTGKGVLARWLHASSPRRDEPFVDLNCAGLGREFFESELLGHEKGAFTGAVGSKPGLLEVAHRGVLFLDEIGDVDPAVQPKLLKVLEEQRFRRLGDVRDRQVDARLVAATHHDLGQLVAAGRFREDLYFRISALPLRVPPLRERGRDVLLLARTLLARVATEMGRPPFELSAGAEAALLAYSWPGNIRELRNVLERVVILSDGPEIVADDLRESLGRRHSASLAPLPERLLTLEEAEQRHVEQVLAAVGGSVNQAAKVLGLSRSALYDRIRKKDAISHSSR